MALVPHSVLQHHEHCARMYQGVLQFSRLKYLNKAMSLQIYKKYSWQLAGAELVISTAHVEGSQVGPTALLHALRHYVLRANGRF